MTLHEVNAAAETIYEVVDPNANIIFGAVIDERLQGEIKITVIATGFSGEIPAQQPVSRTQNANAPWRAATVQVTPAQQTPDSKPKQDFGLDIPEFLRNRRPPR